MKTILFLLLLSAACRAGDLLELCIGVSVAQAGATPNTLALRATLTATDSTEDQRRVASMQLNAIYNAAVASGRMECLRIQAIASEQARKQAQDRMWSQFLLMQGANFQQYPYLPR